jgi:4-aminobutyrate aminotransferase
MLKREHLSVPDVRTPLPGPRAKELIESDERVSSPSYTRAYPLAVKRGFGAVIEDLDGNRFLDFTAGIAVCSTGHCHPRIVNAISRQAQQLIHMSGTDFYYAPQRDLARKLAALAPGEQEKRVFFTNSGAEAVEAAIKLARRHTGRWQIIAFLGAFHGRTLGALSLTASKVNQRRGFGPLVPGVTHVGYGDCYRCPYNRSYASCDIDCVRHIEEFLFRHTVSPEEVAAIVVEPIQGEGGYVVPPPEFLPRLKELSQKYGILLVADEVQSGMGRTGKMFAVEHWNVEPDVICLAKGIASGMPLGAMIASAEIMDWPPGAHASTFGGNPISCAAALETIALLEEELIENAAVVGGYLLAQLHDLAQRHALIGDVRGKGLMVGIDLVRDRQSKQPAVAERDAVVNACFQQGLLVLGCGPSTIRLSPPLIVTREDADTAVDILDRVLGAAAAKSDDE